jgi:phage virion morphogenesis protein
MANITVRIDDAELRKAIDRVIDHMADLTPAMQEIGDYMITATRSRFDTETAPDGSKWAALSPRYAARKARMRSVVDGGKRILAKRGTLRDTIRYKASRSDVVIGSDRPYAAIHQFGGDIQNKGGSRTLNFKVGRNGRSRFAKRGKANFQQTVNVGASSATIPARPFLGISADDQQEIIRILAKYLT